MNIKYEDIIEKANQRKLALQEFERQTSRVAELLNMLEISANIYASVYAAWNALDTEGKKMLPSEVQRLMPYMGKAEDLRNMISLTSSCRYGLEPLLDALEEN